MHPLFANILEHSFSRPFEARDWILHAISDDGREWQKDKTFRYNPLPLAGFSMSYYTTKDMYGGIWHHSSQKQYGQSRWLSYLRSVTQEINAKEIFADHLYSPCWQGDKLYAILKGTSDGVNRAVLIKNIFEKTPESMNLSFDGIENARINDIYVALFNDQYYAWTTIDEKIYQWCSINGIFWQDGQQVMSSPYPDNWYKIANNPCVVKAEGGWRLYFRSGKQPAIGNQVFSAFSEDLKDWVLEEGARISPGGKWDTHGVGFPFVYYDTTEKIWHMYYGGFWGDSKVGEKTKQAWQQHAEELKAMKE